MWNSHFYDNEYNITIHFYDLKKRRPSLPDIDNDSRVWNCVPNREYCQQIIRTENSMQILTSCLLTERHHPFKTNWLKSEKRTTARKGEFFKSNMDAMTVLSMWDTVLNESSLTETSILLIEFHFLQREVSLDLNLMIVSVWQWSAIHYYLHYYFEEKPSGRCHFCGRFLCIWHSHMELWTKEENINYGANCQAIFFRKWLHKN